MLKKLFVLIFIFFFAMTPLTGEEKKEEPKKPKVKTGVEVEKGDKAPKWEDEILKKKKEQKEKTKEELKKEKKEKKLEKNKKRNEKRKKSGR